MLHEIQVKRIAASSLTLRFESGGSTVIVGANGSGKTRLAAFIENALGEACHRIPAHKSLEFPTEIQRTTLASAIRGLRFGHPQQNVTLSNRESARWNANPATHLLNDTQYLLQALFADHSATAIDYLEKSKTKLGEPVPLSALDKVRSVWSLLFPHRGLHFGEASLAVVVADDVTTSLYNAAAMSDGERAAFYYLGQSLLAPESSVILVDEPEAHLHKAILGPLWDKIEAARPDCAFVYTTHDLDFATQRYAGQRLFVRNYQPGEGAWAIDEMPSDVGIPENVVATLVGSRKPALFIEGTMGSADVALYRAAYHEFTILPLGGSSSVIHAVGTLTHNASLHSLGTVRGLIDSDGRRPEELAKLKGMGVYCLPTSEIEGAFLLPSFLLELAKGFHCPDPAAACAAIHARVFETFKRDIQGVALRHVKRVIDREIRVIDAEVSSRSELGSKYGALLAGINPTARFDETLQKMEEALAAKDIRKVLAIFDSRELLGFAAHGLGLTNKKQLVQKMARFLSVKEGKDALDALRAELPVLA